MFVIANKSFYSRLIAVTAITAVAGLAPMRAGAQTPVLEEVMVTAQKRAQSLQDVSVAVSVVSGDRMEQFGIQTFEDLTPSIPNIHVGENTIGDGLFIRGIGSGVNQGFEQSVGIFIDEVYYGRGRITRAMMFDLERIEILKGPQGILFGKNTIGGALNIASRGASSQLEGYVDGRYEVMDDEFEISAAVGGPIGDNFRARLAARYRDLDGYITNTVLGRDEPSREEVATRFTAEWDVASNFELIGKLQYGELDISGRSNQPSRCTPAYLAFAGPAEDCIFNETRSGVVSLSFLRDEESEKFDFLTVALTANWDVQDHTVTSVTAYVTYDDTTVVDGDFTDKDVLVVDQQEEFDVFSQELRLVSSRSGPLQYIAGAYFETTNLKTRNDWHVNTSLFGLPSGTRLIGNDQESDAWALFAQASYDITDELTVVIGGRYTEETKTNIQDLKIADLLTRTTNPALEPFFSAALNSQPHIFDEKRKTTDFSPSGTIEWRPNIDTLMYGSVKTGFKAGGFDHGAATNQLAAFEYDDETAVSYELGAKLELLEGSATVNVAAFHSTFKKLQVSTFDGALGFKVGNAGKVESKGIEIDGRWRVTPELVLGVAAAYLDSEYDAFPGAQCYAGQTPELGCIGGVQDLAGKPTQFSPEWSGNFTIDYLRPVAGNLELFANLNLYFTDEISIANDLDPHFIQDAYAKVDVRIGIGHPSKGWEIAILGKNLTDEKTFNWGNDVPLFAGSYYKHLDRPLTLAVQGRMRF